MSRGLRWSFLLAFALPFFSLLAQERIEVGGRVPSGAQEKIGVTERLPPPDLHREDRAIEAALAALEGVHERDRYFYRFVRLDDSRFQSAQATSLTLNYISRNSNIKRPILIPPTGTPELVMVDLRYYAPIEYEADNRTVKSDKDFREFAAAWEEFRYDPKFHLLLTAGTLKFTHRDIVAPRWVLKATNPYTGADGKPYNGEWKKERVKIEKIAKDEVIVADSEHINLVNHDKLRLWTQSEAPIVSHRYFILRAFDTIEDDGIYKIIYGGLYYRFTGTEKNLDLIFQQLLLGDGTKGSAERLIAKANSDQRAAVFQSGITDRARRFKIFPLASKRVDRGAGVLRITEDLKARNFDIDTDPLANLLVDIKVDAREAIYSRANGLDGYFLTNGDGLLQTAVPEDVATDNVPHPCRRTFGAGIACNICHAANRGVQILRNDVRLIRGKKTGVNIFDRRIERLFSLYSGDLERVNGTFQRLRDDNARATLDATGPWQTKTGALVPLTDVFQTAAAEFSAIRTRERHKGVDPKTALEELGVRVKDAEEAKKLFRALLPPLVEYVGDDIVDEDFRAAGLFAGVTVLRTHWDLFYPFAASRAQKSAKHLLRK